MDSTATITFTNLTGNGTLRVWYSVQGNAAGVVDIIGGTGSTATATITDVTGRRIVQVTRVADDLCETAYAGNGPLAYVETKVLPVVEMTVGSPVCEGSDATVTFRRTQTEGVTVITYTVNDIHVRTATISDGDTQVDSTIYAVTGQTEIRITAISYSQTGCTRSYQDNGPYRVINTIPQPEVMIESLGDVCDGSEGLVRVSRLTGTGALEVAYTVNGITPPASPVIIPPGVSSVDITLPAVTAPDTVRILSVTIMGSGCENIYTGYVPQAVVKPITLPQVTVSAVQDTVCATQDAAFRIANVNTASQTGLTVLYTINGIPATVTVPAYVNYTDITIAAATAKQVIMIEKVISDDAANCVTDYTLTGTQPSDSVIVNPIPDVDFTVTMVSLSVIDFVTVTTATNIASYSWTFGDGNSSVIANPQHTYAGTGEYTVTLTVVTDDGCSVTVTKTIFVATETDLTPDFWLESESQCLSGNEFTFYNRSNITTTGHSISGYTWDFGDGTPVSTDRNATHTYSAPGTYTVTLIVTEQPGGSSDSIRQNITVMGLPEITDTISVGPVCDNQLLYVNPPAVNWQGNNPITGEWLLGGYLFNPLLNTVSVADSGKLLQYRIITPCGDTTGIGTAISVHALPIANFGTTLTGIGEITFADFSQNAVSWRWDYGDGIIETGTQNPVHTYTQFGTFNVKLTVTNAAGCSHSITIPVTVANPVLIAEFTIADASQCLNGNEFVFTSTSQILTPNHRIDSVAWDFGDGSPVVNTDDATHTYTAAGTYNVTLTVREAPGGTTATMTHTVYVMGTPVIYDTAAVAPVCEGGFLRLVNPPIDWKGNTPVAGTWYLDGTIYNPGTPLTMADSGRLLQYGVELTCASAMGTGVTISVIPSPTANFMARTTDVGIVEFTDISTVLSGTIVEWIWNFGNGETFNGQNPPAVTYTPPGVYPVTLTIVTSTGCRASITRNIDATGAIDLQADFTVNETTQCVGSTFWFFDRTNLTTEGHYIGGWSWNFGDGSPIETSRHTSHTYNAPGDYTVTLIVNELPAGMVDSAKYIIHVLGTPVIDNLAAVAPVCEGERLQVPMPNVDWNGHLPGSERWLLDGYLFDPATPVTAADSGKLLQYSVSANSNLTCSNSTGTGVNIIVYTRPVADFSTQLTALGTVTFTDASTNATSWSWNFGDGNTSDEQNPVHTYTQSGTYNVTLTVTGQGGCSSAITKSISVIVDPPDLSADFIINAHEQCLAGNEFIFRDFSTLTTPNHRISRWIWNFGDGTEPDTLYTGDPVFYNYAQTGTYSVTLTVRETPGGTESSMTKTIKVVDAPVVQNMAAVAAVCEGERLQVRRPDVDWNGHLPGSERWLLDGYLFDPATVVWAADSGKLLQYSVSANSNLTCSNSTAAGVNISVYTRPVADFSTQLTGLGTVTFTDASTNATSWSWNFGDGNTSNEQNPEHTYTQSGTYIVTLTVTGEGGCSSTITKTIAISLETDLSADFTVNTDEQCLAGNEFIFRDFSTITTPNHRISRWIWNYGDGSQPDTLYAGTPVSHSYATAGIYDVTLTVMESPGGTESSWTKTVKVVGAPIVNDMAVVAPVCEGERLQIPMPNVDWNGHAPGSERWLLDGYLFDPATTAVWATDNGKLLQYSVWTNSNSLCGNSTGNGVNITVYARPVADFSTQLTDLGTITFTDASTNATSWSWNFGDGNTSDEQNPVHVYTQSDTYMVTLTVTGEGGCSSTITKTIAISLDTDLSADFTVNTDEQCLDGNEFIFRDMSTLTTPNHRISRWIWSYGDGISDTLYTSDPASHTYTAAGTYYVTLTVTESPGNTESSWSQTVRVLDAPVVRILPA